MYIKRERYLAKIRPFYDVDLIKVLTGVRRSGKSVLLTQIKEELSEKGVDAAHIIEINFENIEYERIRSMDKLDSYIKKKIQDQNKYYIFLDEIQHVRSFEKVLTSLRATQNCSIFITGSNSKLLSGKMATLLVGRCIEFRIMPFSFKEAMDYFQLKGQQVNPDEKIYYGNLWGAKRKHYIKRLKSSLQDPVHIDICSYNELRRVDPGVLKYDVFLMLAIPFIMEKVQPEVL